MHHLLRAADVEPVPVYPGSSGEAARASVIDRSTGSVHIGMGICELGAGGFVDDHVHSFEESFFVLEGEPVLYLDGEGVRLEPGACGVVPVGVRHAWRSAGGARWIDACVPQPRTTDEGVIDTFFVGPAPDSEPRELDVRDPRSRHLFLLTDGQMELDNLKLGAPVDAPTVSASMATALLAYSGIAVKMLVDERLDAALGNMFMVEYEPGGIAQPHDHPLEESYVILDGEVEAVADGERYTLREGDVFWTGVGCVHAFYNTSNARVRWLETQTPLPPRRHSYRFERDWQYLEEKLRETVVGTGASDE